MRREQEVAHIVSGDAEHNNYKQDPITHIYHSLSIWRRSLGHWSLRLFIDLWLSHVTSFLPMAGVRCLGMRRTCLLKGHCITVSFCWCIRDGSTLGGSCWYCMFSARDTSSYCTICISNTSQKENTNNLLCWNLLREFSEASRRIFALSGRCDPKNLITFG